MSSSLVGDRRTYQQDPGNIREAVHEIELDIEEGADMVMVKPAMSYLDVVRAAADISPVPVAAYQISGEYAMISAAAANGWIDLQASALESLIGIRRAGADIVLTYWAADVAAGWRDSARPARRASARPPGWPPGRCDHGILALDDGPAVDGDHQHHRHGDGADTQDGGGSPTH